MNENAISYKLNRINNAVDRIRVKTNTTGQPIENVATAVEEVEMIGDYFVLEPTATGMTYLTESRYGGWIKIIKKLPKIRIKLSDYSSYFYHLIFDLDLTGVDTSIATKLTGMFQYSRVESLDLSSFDTSNVTDMSAMFYQCNFLTSVNVSSFNTSKVTDMSFMFAACHISSLDLSNFDTSKVTNMKNMFGGSEKHLQHLDIRNFDFTSVTSYDYMFSSAKDNCLIIVKDDTAKSWITSKFTNLTNVKTVAEYEASL